MGLVGSLVAEAGDVLRQLVVLTSLDPILNFGQIFLILLFSLCDLLFALLVGLINFGERFYRVIMVLNHILLRGDLHVVAGSRVRLRDTFF